MRAGSACDNNNEQLQQQIGTHWLQMACDIAGELLLPVRCNSARQAVMGTNHLGIDTVLGKAACALPLHVIFPGELREAPAKIGGAQWGCTHT